jgi:hypothetical protein
MLVWFVGVMYSRMECVMGILDIKFCENCSELIGVWQSRYILKTDNQCICKTCLVKTGVHDRLLIRSSTITEIQDFISKHEDVVNFYNINFSPTIKVKGYLHIDEVNRRWIIPTKKCDYTFFSYDDIISYELIEDGTTISSNLSNAISGGVLMGGIGAVIGASTGKKTKQICESMRIKITLNSMESPLVYIDFIQFATNKTSILYKNAQDAVNRCLSLFEIMKYN